jgi:hypothetical protein
MSKAKAPTQALVMQMREEGRSRDDTGVFEIDLVENKIVWANDFVLERLEFTLDQIKHMTLFDIIPEAFHQTMQSTVTELSTRKSEGEKKRTAASIWPSKTASGKITWWAITESTMDFPLIWVHGDHVQTTGQSGMSFLFMQAFMRAANGQSGLYDEVSELKAWTSTQIARLDEADKQLRLGLADLESKIDDALAASKEAATASKDTRAVLQSAFKDFETKYGGELLKLIGTDTVHDKKIEAFEKQIKVMTDLAIESLRVQAQKMTQGITTQAEASSKGISRKVIIPVSLIATIAAIIELALRIIFKNVW